jgi:hypothetical protein
LIAVAEVVKQEKMVLLAFPSLFDFPYSKWESFFEEIRKDYLESDTDTGTSGKPLEEGISDPPIQRRGIRSILATSISQVVCLKSSRGGGSSRAQPPHPPEECSSVWGVLPNDG